VTRTPVSLPVAILLLVGSGAGGTLATASTTEESSVAVDFSRPDEHPRSMVGFLHGLGQTEPPGDLIAPLRPALWRGTPNSAPYDRVRHFGARYILLLSDLWGYPANNLPHGRAYEHTNAWAHFVRQVASQFRGQDVIFDVWNEPDTRAFWDGNEQQFFQTYAIAARILREVVGPDVQIAGPSLGQYNADYITRFLDACLAARGCRMSALAWHEFPGPSPPISTITDHLREARRRFLNAPKYQRLGLQNLYVTESVNQYAQYRPGDILASLSALERGGADGAARACWRDPHDRDQCFNHTLDGLVTPGRFRPLSPWWTYKLYADGTATRVHAVGDGRSVVALASADSATPGALQLLLGRFASGSEGAASKEVTVDIQGLSTLSSFAAADSMIVTFERIPDQGNEPLRAPRKAGRRTVALHDGRARVHIPRFALHDAYLVSLTPGSRRATKPASVSRKPHAVADTAG
jgi:xylan 1,4-beta-xylosidase